MAVNSVGPTSNFAQEYGKKIEKSTYKAQLVLDIAESLMVGRVPVEQATLLMEDVKSDKVRDIVLGSATFLATALGLSKGVLPKVLNKILPARLANATFGDIAKGASKLSASAAEKLAPKFEAIGKSENPILKKAIQAKDAVTSTKLAQGISDNIAKLTPEKINELASNPVSKFIGIEKPANALGLGIVSVPAAIAAKNAVNDVADKIDDVNDLNKYNQSIDYTI